jgi:hypothetical protein
LTEDSLPNDNFCLQCLEVVVIVDLAPRLKGVRLSVPAAVAVALVILATPGHSPSAQNTIPHQTHDRLRGPFDWVEIMTPDEPWEYGNISTPFVLFENGLYRMWYSIGQPFGAGTIPFRGGVAHAVSIDGIHWGFKEPLFTADPQVESLRQVYRPIVIKDDDLYRMFVIHDRRIVANHSSEFIVLSPSPLSRSLSGNGRSSRVRSPGR